jgi:septal ring factor EnvC (AmiA/AmiB activator)
VARIDDLRRKLAARDGVPGFKKNCEALRTETARLQQAPAPSTEEMETAWKAAEEARASESETTSPENSDAPPSYDL